ncbi:MAG: DGQHR domain-containing protein [Acidobacteriia bacterium]|nr:DGQHR domain-containing protein [Terriglobia bacterium]
MKTTYFPCVRGTMGDWTYYVTVMGVGDLVRYVRFAEELSPNPDLDSMIQRELTNRAKDIADYLSMNEQRFFGSLIIAALDGQPRFRPIAFDESLLAGESRVGVLQFDGTEQYYALDGQHRLAAFQIELKREPERYKDDQVSTIVICHNDDKEGRSRARRLFTTVNRYAKKTSPATHTAMSEDDGVALVTRRLIREHELFKQRIKVKVSGRDGKQKLATGNAMSATSAADRPYLMAIETFRKCNKDLLPSHLIAEFKKEQQIPSFESLEEAFSSLSDSWDKMIKAVDPWKELLKPQATVEDYRTVAGGHILVRPIGITAFVGAMATAPGNMTIKHIKAVVENFQDLNGAPWKGVLWNSATKKMTVTVEAEKLARRLWRHLLGLGEDRTKLTQDWRAMVEPGSVATHLKLPDPPKKTA